MKVVNNPSGLQEGEQFYALKERNQLVPSLPSFYLLVEIRTIKKKGVLISIYPL